MTVRNRHPRLAFVAAVLVLALVTAAAYAGLVVHRASAEVFLPRPSGPYAVGRVERTWTDARRHRGLAVWAWYPAASGRGRAAVYAPGAWARLRLPFPVGLGETDLRRVRDQALAGVRPRAGRFPLVVLEPGMGLAVPQYSVLAEELASRGFVVAGVTPTGSANLTVVGGDVVGATQDGNPSGFSGSHEPGDLAVARRLLRRWVADARFTARRSGRWGALVDVRRTAYVGHSFGGAAALEACREDLHCRAAVDLDGTVYGPVARRGLTVPTLLLGHDGSCVSGLCRPRSPDDEADVRTARGLRQADAGTSVGNVDGTGHFGFTDYGAYYLAAPLRLLVPVGSRDGQDALREIADRVGDFLQRTLASR